MPSRTSPSPSPTPTIPQQTTTDPGPRALALRKIYTSALTSTLKLNNYANFAACFPTPATYCPTALEGVWRQLNTRLEEECQKDFEKILEERRVVEGLNALDDLVGKARERRDNGEKEPVALHMLGAKDLGDLRVQSLLVRARDEVTGKLGGAQRENVRVAEEVRGQRLEIEVLMGGLETLVRDLEGAVKVLEGVDGEELRREVWDLESELKSVG